MRRGVPGENCGARETLPVMQHTLDLAPRNLCRDTGSLPDEYVSDDLACKLEGIGISEGN